jgi:hypothetical protein
MLPTAGRVRDVANTVCHHATIGLIMVSITDNIFNMRTWASQKLNVQRSDFDKNFGIPGDFDYLEPEQ